MCIELSFCWKVNLVVFRFPRCFGAWLVFLINLVSLESGPIPLREQGHEKHFYIPYADGPDHAASVTPKEFKAIYSMKSRLVYGMVKKSNAYEKNYAHKKVWNKRSMEIEENLSCYGL